MKSNGKMDWRVVRRAVLLGFAQGQDGMWYHKRLNTNQGFDFSACSPDGIILRVFMQGLKDGKECNQQEIRRALGLEDLKA